MNDTRTMPDVSVIAANWPITMKDIGDRIKEARTERGLSASALAREATIHRNHLHAVESGTTNPPLLTIYLLAAALDVPVQELLGLNLSLNQKTIERAEEIHAHATTMVMRLSEITMRSSIEINACLIDELGAIRRLESGRA